MTATVQIHTGEKTVWDYLMKPFFKAQNLLYKNASHRGILLPSTPYPAQMCEFSIRGGGSDPANLAIVKKSLGSYRPRVKKIDHALFGHAISQDQRTKPGLAYRRSGLIETFFFETLREAHVKNSRLRCCQAQGLCE